MVATVRRCGPSRPWRCSTSIMPSTPFIGVRISWLMVARKVDFAWLAASASARSFSAASRARLGGFLGGRERLLAALQLVEQPRGLDGDHGLIGERLHELDLPSR